VGREGVLVVLALCVCGPLTLACAAVPTRNAVLTAGWELERFWWRRVCLPVLPTVLGIALLVGWALQEPEQTDEVVSRIAIWFALVFAPLWIRAGSRAIRSLRRRSQRTVAAATVGILRPRVIISADLEQMVDPDTLAAAREHEAAHARHADPLRIWLGQLATDLQWPCPAASARWRAWREALEFARDDEARSRGTDGADLAEAILASVRLRRCGPRAPVAMLGDDVAGLRARIQRLLEPLSANALPPSTRPVALLFIGTGIVGAVVLGVFWGDQLLRALPFVGS